MLTGTSEDVYGYILAAFFILAIIFVVFINRVWQRGEVMGRAREILSGSREWGRGGHTVR